MATATAKKPDATARPTANTISRRCGRSYYARIAKHDMAPLWTVMSTLIPDEPVTRCRPAVWHFDDVKSLVMEVGQPDHRGRGQAPRADPGKPGAARRNAASPTRCSPAFR